MRKKKTIQTFIFVLLASGAVIIIIIINLKVQDNSTSHFSIKQLQIIRKRK